MTSRRQQDPPAILRFRTSPSPAPAALFANGQDERVPPPPPRVNMALSGWLQDRFPPPLPLASLSSAASAAAAASAASSAAAPPPNAGPLSSSLRFELAAAAAAPATNNDKVNSPTLVGGSSPTPPTARRRRINFGPPPEAPDSAVAALDGLRCGGCAAPLVPSAGETSDARRRRAAALTRVCAGCRQAFHAGCAQQVGKMLGGCMLLRHVPGTPLPWEGAAGGAEGGGALLAAMAGRGPLPPVKQKPGETREQLAERLVREQQVVNEAVARDGHWFHSFSCARVASSLAAQAHLPPVPIDPLPPGAADGGGGARHGSGGGGDENENDGGGIGGPFAWLKARRLAEMRRSAAMLRKALESSSSSSEEGEAKGEADANKGKEDKAGAKAKAPAKAAAAKQQQPSPSSRTWALIDLSRLRAEPGDPPGRTGPGAKLRPDVNALIDVLVQSYGPGAADEVVGLTSAAAGGDDDKDGSGGGGAGGRPRRRVGGGIRDGRYAVLLRDSPERGSAPLCAALLESYGTEAATIGLVATRLSRRGEGHAAALLDATALFLRDGLGTRRLLASGAPVASDPVSRGLFLGKGGEAAVRREQARVQAELRRHGGGRGGGGEAAATRERRVGGGGDGDGDGEQDEDPLRGSNAGDLVTGLLAVDGSPSLAPYVGKERIYWSPPHAPRFRRLARGEARELAAELPALGRRLEAGGALGRRGGVLGWLLGAGVQDGEWLVRDLEEA